MWLSPVINLCCRPQVFVKIQNGILKDPGETIHEKARSRKCSLWGVDKLILLHVFQIIADVIVTGDQLSPVLLLLPVVN
jgi:hypothetical protein